MTTYCRTFEITETDQRTLKTMVYRDRWMQSVFECLVLATQVQRASREEAAKVAISLMDSEQIHFEEWLKDESPMGKVSPAQGAHEQACKERVAISFREAEPEVNSWLDFGDGRSTLSRNTKL